jgi:predicted metal-dependent phosphotriesterase family hydrolase
MACQEDFYLVVTARGHHCPWESRWRSWSGRSVPSWAVYPFMPQDIEEGVERTPTKPGLVGRFFNFFKG